MGIVKKEFSAQTVGEPRTGEAVVDSGAAFTTLRFDLACHLGLDTKTAARMSARSASGQLLVGYRMAVCIRVDAREACVAAFVPTARRTDRGDESFQVARNLIGADFLQASHAKLDYDKPHDETFSGIDLPSGLYDFGPATADEAKALRKSPACPSTRRRKRG